MIENEVNNNYAILVLLSAVVAQASLGASKPNPSFDDQTQSAGVSSSGESADSQINGSS